MTMPTAKGVIAWDSNWSVLCELQNDLSNQVMDPRELPRPLPLRDPHALHLHLQELPDRFAYADVPELCLASLQGVV